MNRPLKPHLINRASGSSFNSEIIDDSFLLFLAINNQIIDLEIHLFMGIYHFQF